MLTEFQSKKFTHLFHVFDTDKNNFLEKSDFDKIAIGFAEAYNIAPDSETYQYISSIYAMYWDTLAKHADNNSDQKVTLDEWLSYFDKYLNEPKSEFIWLKLASTLCNIMDTDKDGALSVEEYKTVYKIYGIGDASLAAEIFSNLDFDGDGKIRINDVKNLVADFYLSNNPQAPGNLFFGSYE